MPAAPDVPPAETTTETAAATDALEARIGDLRAAVRRAIANGDRQAARVLRSELRQAEEAWDEAVLGSGGPAHDVRRPLVPVRDQVHQALTLLGAPAAPKLIGSVYAAFFPGDIPGSRLTSLRRDEERSFRTAPYARPFYLCPALTADLLSPARGLLAVSTWPQAQRIVGPLSARADFLTAAIRVAEQAGRGPDGSGVQRLLWRFAANIPGATAGTVGTVDPAVLAEAARAELDVHRDADRHQRERAAERALAQLDDAGRLFGSRLHALRRTGSGNATDGENTR
ncbi:hypothetical protein [Actinomadura rudentiformis]|uniref:Uncharacterized protein n=1 Tax=Actinomadura rudentiformis TaxID=359158 RepID=A0A6H9YKG7_9ACTN|nr:hypothetical protein [Actinomadura rudentiformis]KAB2346837.1 hypothetical protein F8566_21710 [Actinomadura rudentiformis]